MGTMIEKKVEKSQRKLHLLPVAEKMLNCVLPVTKSAGMQSFLCCANYKTGSI
jgi:hypothetical protein